MAERMKKAAATKASAAASRARGLSSAEQSSAPPVRIHKTKAEEARTKALAEAPIVPNLKRIGRPRNTPDTWTPEFIAAVVADMERYTEATQFPTEAEFCYTRGIHHQRLSECPELRAARDMMFAKRQAMVIKRGLQLGVGEGALGSFLIRLAVNAGSFSLTDKQELEHSGSIGVRIVDDIQ